MTLDKPIRVTRFEWYATREIALEAATAWINDHTKHGTIYLQAINAGEEPQGWFSSVSYVES